MTAYMNPKDLRELADVMESLPEETTQATLQNEKGSVAVWWDEESARFEARPFDLDEIREIDGE
jgi:hypothetical protein